ncbi:thioredoxin family protein [Larkinella humicola]|uniref:Thioredoxin family protein n=1 Tax=Larkinella humicola TaxID=2607654 RepID=A0A5N1JMX5_9BACT|nr:thioredoxin family protein [Larkinella humicola]KAA9357501.1 thioredoxin family protein [Larkinella humicola]
MKVFLLSVLAFFAVSAPQWQLNLDQAKAEAEKSHKLILLNFSGSDWCGPCIKLKKDIFESEAFQVFATDHLVLVRADFPRLSKNKLDARQEAHNEALAEKYNKKGKFPFTVLLDTSGRVLNEWDGYSPSMTASSVMASIQAANAGQNE